MLTTLLWTLALPAWADTDRCTEGGVARVRVPLASAPWREGTLVAEGCLADPANPAPGDWQRVLFIRNDGGVAWSRALGAQDATGEVWWRSAELSPEDVDGDGREEVIVRGELSNCGEGGCVAGTALLYLWPDLHDGGPSCGRRGFEEGERGRLLTWVNARFDVPGWAGPSWVRGGVTREAPGHLLVSESWTAMPPAAHDPMDYTTRIYVTSQGLLPHCATTGAPGI